MPLQLAQSTVKSEELEAAMLNKIINDEHVSLLVMHLLNDDCFTTPSHKFLFKTLCRLDKDGVKIANTSVYEYLKDSLTEEGANKIIAETAESVFGDKEVAEPEYMARRLQEYAIRRALTDMIIELNRLVSDMTLPLAEGVQNMMKLFDKTLMGGGDTVVSLTEVLDDVRQIRIDNQTPKTQHLGVLTGLPKIDETGGLPRDGLVVIGAKPSHGKTTFAINLAVNALLANHKVGCFSMEMNKEKIAGRIVAMKSGVDSNAIMRLKLTQFDMQRTEEAIARLQQAVAKNFYFDNRRVRDVTRLFMTIRSLHRTHQIDVFVIDYVQLIKPSPGMHCDNKNELYADLSHDLHALAQDLRVTIILLSQVNRSAVGMPTTSQLRGSGEIDEAADMVILLYNAFKDHTQFPAPFETIDPEGKLYVDVAKGRDGSTYSFLTGFNPSLTLITPLEQKDMNKRSQQLTIFPTV